MNMYTMIAGVLCAALTGCGGGKLILDKPGVTAQEFANDHYDCKVQGDRGSGAMAYRQDPLAHLAYLSQARQDMIECMQRRGYTVVTPQ